MTIEEAIRALASSKNFDMGNLKDCETFNLAIEALAKQLARKPDEQPSFYDTCLCPRCCAILVKSFKHNYCQRCGQKLDWSNVKNGNESK